MATLPAREAAPADAPTAAALPESGMRRWLILLAIVVLVAAGASVFTVSAFQAAKTSQQAGSPVATVAAEGLPAAPL